MPSHTEALFFFFLKVYVGLSFQSPGAISFCESYIPNCDHKQHVVPTAPSSKGAIAHRQAVNGQSFPEDPCSDC
jgi:hypothetical protein